MIELRDVVVAYDTRVILDSVNLTIEDGETLVILGGSGSGSRRSGESSLPGGQYRHGNQSNNRGHRSNFFHLIFSLLCWYGSYYARQNLTTS